MFKGRSNYGADVFFRRLRMVIRNFFICAWTSIFFGLVSGFVYVFLVMPEGSWKLVPQYTKYYIKWKFKKDGGSGQFVLEVQEFFAFYSGHLMEGVYFGLGSAGIGFFMLGFLFWKIGHRNQENSLLRGSEVITPKQLQKELSRHSKFGFLNGYNLGKNAPKIWEEYIWRGMAIVGRPGTGKSNLIRIMLNQDLNRNAKCFIVDINGDYWRKFGRPKKDKILSLRHKDSEYWDFKSEDVVSSLIASYLVPKSNSGPSFWWKAARGILTSLLEHSSNLDDFKEKIAQSDGNILKLLEENEEIVSKVLGKAGSSQSAGVLGSTVLDFSFIKDLGYWPKNQGKTKPFSITEWATDKNDDSWVYVVVRDDELEEIKPLVACWFNLAINGCFRRDEEGCYKGEYPSIRIVLDELKSLGKLEELEKAGERLRKYRASLVVGYQNNAQLDSIYGPQGAENLKDVLQMKVIYSVGDPKAQEELSKLLGEQEVEEMNANISYGKRDSDGLTESHKTTRRRVVLPSELGKLGDGDCYMKFGPFDPAKAHVGYRDFANINPPLAWGQPPKSIAKHIKSSKPESIMSKSLSATKTEKKPLVDDSKHSGEQDPRQVAKKLRDRVEIEMEY